MNPTPEKAQTWRIPLKGPLSVRWIRHQPDDTDDIPGSVGRSAG